MASPLTESDIPQTDQYSFINEEEAQEILVALRKLNHIYLRSMDRGLGQHSTMSPSTKDALVRGHVRIMKVFSEEVEAIRYVFDLP